MDNSILENCIDDYTIVVTPQCNSNCVMCPSPAGIRKIGKMRSIEEIIDEIRNIPSDVPHITVTGGEPTLIGMDFFLLMEELNRCFPQTPVLYLTNARIFAASEYSKKFLIGAKYFDTVAVPIHSYIPEKHDAITQATGSFTQTIRGLNSISSSTARIEIRVVVSKLNVKDILSIIKMIMENISRITVLNFIALEMTGNAAMNRDEIWVDYQEAFEALKPCIPLLIERCIEVNLYNWPLCTVERSHWSLVKKSISDYKVRYADSCSGCTVKELCGGEFASNVIGRYFTVAPIGETA